MQDLNQTTITDAVREQMALTGDSRLRQIMEAAVRHLHDFARETSLTPEEWLAGIGFLTQVGQTCTPVRQEFILLSDVLGVSALVNALHDEAAAELGTQSSLLGPFFREAAPDVPLGGSIVASPTVPLLTMYGKVTDTAGRGIPASRTAGDAGRARVEHERIAPPRGHFPVVRTWRVSSGTA